MIFEIGFVICGVLVVFWMFIIGCVIVGIGGVGFINGVFIIFGILVFMSWWLIYIGIMMGFL